LIQSLTSGILLSMRRATWMNGAKIGEIDNGNRRGS
jgi:hypothetical protein